METTASTPTSTAPTESESTICPNCDRSTTHRELAEHRGVCKFCHKSFSAAHTTAMLTKQQRESENTIHHHHPMQDGEAWTDTGELVEIHNFDYDEVDQALGLAPKERTPVQAQATAAMKQILRWILTSESSGRMHKLQTILQRTLAVGYLLDPSLIDGADQTRIGALLCRTKAAVSKSVVEFQRRFEVHFRQTRTDGSREAMRRAAILAHKRRKQRALNGHKTTEAT